MNPLGYRVKLQGDVDLLVRHKHLPPTHYFGQRNRSVSAPVVHGRDVVHENDKVIRVAAVDHLRGLIVRSRHGEWSVSFFVPASLVVRLEIRAW